MTIVVGFTAPDGAVMASDSRATEADGSSFDVDDKIWSCGELLLGYSGSSAIKQPLQASLHQALDGEVSLDRWKARAEIAAAAKPVLESAYATFVQTSPQRPIEQVLGGTLIVIGCDTRGYWLMDLDMNCTSGFYDGFHSVGSGSIAAQVARGLLEHYLPRGRTTDQLKLLAYRTVAICIRALGNHGVGGDIHIWRGQGGAAFEKADAGKVAEIEHGLAEWVTIEQESLEKVAVGAEAKGTEEAGAAMPSELEGGGEEPGPPAAAAAT